MKWAFVFLLIASQAQAFTLNNNFGAAFGQSKLNVRIAGNTTCGNIQINDQDLEDLVAPAVNNFWNRVPTSSLRLISQGFSDHVPDINEGLLCSPTDDDCFDNAGADAIIPPVNEIVIACNINAKNFGKGTNSNVLAVTIPNHFKGKTIKGAVILINNGTGSVFGNLSRADQISVIAHEIGHAIGLGHAEDKNNDALMYYKVVNLRRSLGQDDMDGVSYLYPVKMDGCGLLSGTINKIDSAGGGAFMGQAGIGFLLMLILSRLKKLLRRPKARTPA